MTVLFVPGFMADSALWDDMVEHRGLSRATVASSVHPSKRKGEQRIERIRSMSVTGLARAFLRARLLSSATAI